MDSGTLNQALAECHPFAWGSVRKNPKGNHGVVRTRQDWFKTMTYHLLDSNGFLLLHTLRGRVYWISQNTTNHTTPDWKLHFSVCEDDLGVAWNILAEWFMESKCEVGMKVTTSGSSFCRSTQRGREITVYVYQYDAALRRGVMYERSPDMNCDVYIGDNTTASIADWPALGSREGHIADASQLVEYESDFYLGPEIEAPYSPKFWYDFISEAERRLQRAGVRSNDGVAEGDLPLPGCRFASLRNEAFVVEPDRPSPAPVVVVDGDRHVVIGTNKPQLQYPSNQAGWNAAGHRNPLEETVYLLLLRPPLAAAPR